MKPEEFCTLIAAAKLDQTAAAEKLGVNRRTIYRWMHGTSTIGEAAALLIRTRIKPKK